ncbi:glycoside hydrolase family 25 protein [Streptomyces mirabilis]|uniref:glycoside hydrolase family 25 protein n=1 Tax=Streptomyces mirabilis TaxID=68239 RepID=UPI003320A3B9
MLKGIDVSSYQSSTYSTTGLAFVGIKVTEGLSYVNPKWTAQRATARAAGLVTIFYHYPHVSNSPTAEADHFLSQINLTAGDVLCLDWEWYGQTVTSQQARDYKDAWLAHVKARAPGHKVGIYSDTSSWKNVDTNSNCGDFLWIADYTTAGQPRIKAKWLFHQYSDQPTDLDVANFATVADLTTWAGSSTPAPPAVPQWQKLLDHVMSVPEGAYEHWNANGGWDNHTQWGVEFGEDGVPYCVIGAWDMYHECGLDAVVPKTDNVNAFAAWARSNGQWTEYPSVGAWTDFGAGAHCEVVIGFTATTVTTKGWNSVQTGSTDAGQGNGVWVHTNDRTDPRITGYLAPRFPDGHCPPTADPHDPRGGTAQTAYIPEDPMPTADEIAQAVLNAQVDDATDSTGKTVPFKTQVWNATAAATHANGGVAALTAQVGALSGAITALTKAGGITAEQVQAAAAAGAKAALDELAAALGKAGA